MQTAKALTISAGNAAMPAVGFGTMLFPEPERAVELIVHALESGYRHIDTRGSMDPSSGSVKPSVPLVSSAATYGSRRR